MNNDAFREGYKKGAMATIFAIIHAYCGGMRNRTSLDESAAHIQQFTNLMGSMLAVSEGCGITEEDMERILHTVAANIIPFQIDDPNFLQRMRSDSYLGHTVFEWAVRAQGFGYMGITRTPDFQEALAKEEPSAVATNAVLSILRAKYGIPEKPDESMILEALDMRGMRKEQEQERAARTSLIADMMNKREGGLVDANSGEVEALQEQGMEFVSLDITPTEEEEN